jgi:hypothetical protein
VRVAALFVERDGAYYGLPDVDPWDKERRDLLLSIARSMKAHAQHGIKAEDVEGNSNG